MQRSPDCPDAPGGRLVLPVTPRYAEHSPPSDLRAAVACTWVARAPADAVSSQAVLVDACADVVVIGESAPRVAGPATRTHVVGLAPGVTIVGIRFRPGAARAAFGCDATAIRDLNGDLRDVCDGDEAVLAAELSAAETTEAMRAALERWARRRLAVRLEHDAPTLRAAHALVTGRVRSVGALATALGWSARRLHREMSATCGYGPKMLQRIVRLQHTLRRARRGRVSRGAPPLSLSALALDGGYADQAHMTREFRDLTGFTPRELVAPSRADVGRWLDERD